MRNEFKPYFDSIYGMAPFGSNNILFTAEYTTIAKNEDQLTQLQVAQLLSFKNPAMDEENWSRDNHYGFLALSKRFNLTFHNRLYPSNIKYALQPGDLIFFLWASGGLISTIVSPLLFVTSIAMILSVLITSYKSINGKEVLATDGQLLTWLAINNFNLPITKYLCDKIVNKKYGGYYTFFHTYFGPNHPNTVLFTENGLK